MVTGPVAAGTGRAARSGSAQAPATPVGGTRGGEAFLPLAGRGCTSGDPARSAPVRRTAQSSASHANSAPVRAAITHALGKVRV